MVSVKNLPDHAVGISSLTPRKGDRVQIDVQVPISDEACSAFIEAYRSKGAPDGQVSVHMPSNVSALNSSIVPRCVENFDGDGIVFNQDFFI